MKMAIPAAIHKINPMSQECDLSLRWQSFRLILVQVDAQDDFGLWGCWRIQQAKATRLDQAKQAGRACRNQLSLCTCQNGLVIGHQHRTKRHQAQSQAGFPGTRSSDQQKPTPVDRDRCCVHEQGCHPLSDRQADHKARAQRIRSRIRIGGTDILGPDHAAMGFDDLFGDRQPEA